MRLCVRHTVPTIHGPAGQVSGDSITVGDFVVRLAGAMSLPLEDEASPIAALAALKAATTLDKELDLKADLTEGHVVYLVGVVGVQLDTFQADQPLSQTGAQSFFQLFGDALARQGRQLARSEAAETPAPGAAGPEEDDEP